MMTPTPPPPFSIAFPRRLPVIHRLYTQVHAGIRFMGGFSMLALQAIRECLYPPYYFRLVIDQVFSIGVQSFVLVAVTALATGSVMALQFGYGLARFGGKLYVPRIVSLAILREMGPVFTSLLVAGRI